MDRDLKSELRSFLSEALLYAAVLFAYFAAVLHFLGAWLYHLFVAERELYAFVAVALLAAQGLLLEELTRRLSSWIGRRRWPTDRS